MTSIPYTREGSLNIRMPKDYGYVYEEVDNWAALEDLIDPKEGDIVYIKNLVTTGVGFVLYQHKGQVIYSSGEWKLIKAEAFSETKLNEYITEDSYPAINGCIGIVCGNAAPTGSSKYYFWNSSTNEWIRTPEKIGYVRALPEVALADISALLAVQDPKETDRALVYDTGYGTYGWVDFASGDWYLDKGAFPTVANMEAFPSASGINVKDAGVGIVPALATNPTDADQVYYVYVEADGLWERTPAGVHYIFSQVTDWASLPTEDIVKNNDEIHVQSLGTAHSSGTAQKHGGTSWQLIDGKFGSVADMLAFDTTNDVATDAIALVKSGGGHDEESIAYTYQGGAFVRLGATTTQGYAWAITDLTNIDPSGIGATQIGDFAQYTNPTTGAVAAYRLRAVTVDSAIGGGTITTWVPASIYGEAGLTIRGYLIGNETIPASNGTVTGYRFTYAGSSTITSTGGEIVLTSTVSGQFANVKSTYALQTADRFYIRRNIRLSQTAANNLTFYDLAYANGTGQPWFVMTQNPTKSGNFVTSDTTANLVGSTLMIRGGGTPLTNTAELVEYRSDGSAATDLVNVSRNALPYLSMRKNAQTGTDTGQHLIQAYNGANVSHIARFSQLYFMTY